MSEKAYVSSLIVPFGGLLLLVGGCEPITPERTTATWDTENTSVTFSHEVDESGEPVLISEGLTGYYLDGTFGLGKYPNPIIAFDVSVNDFTIKETTPASLPSPPGVDDEATASYRPGCTDTTWSRETIAGGGILFYYYEPIWSPYDCPGPETDGSISQKDWDHQGHIAVYFNGIYIGAGYGQHFELEVLRQPLFYSPDYGDFGVDRNGVIQPWVDKNNDGWVDFGQDYDLDGVIRGPESEEPDSDHDGMFDVNEYDRDGDGVLDTVWEDVDEDGHLDVNEDAAGNNNGLEDPGEDLDCDGNLDVNELATGCWIDADGDGWVDYEDEDSNGNGVLDPGEDPDLDGDCRIDMPDMDGDGVVDASEDINGDGSLDVIEDVDGDGVFSVSEDLDGDGWQDLDETALAPQCPGKPYGCEGDDVLLITSGDYLMAVPLLYFGVDGFFTHDSDPWYACNANLLGVLTLKLVHDDHSDIYGAPTLSFDITEQDMLDMGLLDAPLADGGTTPYGWILL